MAECSEMRALRTRSERLREATRQHINALHLQLAVRMRLEQERIMLLHELLLWAQLRRDQFRSDGTVH